MSQKDKDKVFWEEIKKMVREEVLAERMNVKLKIKKLPNFCGSELKYQTPGSVGIDLYAAEDVNILKNNVGIVPLGIAIKVPLGYEAQIRSRSGLSIKLITVGNSPGTIDQDYTNEVQAIIYNNRVEGFAVKKGERICQMVIAPVAKCEIEYVDEIPKTERTGGFGSTGRF